MYIHVAVKNKSKVVNFCTVYSTISNYNDGVAIYILQFSVTKIPINTLRQQKKIKKYILITAFTIHVHVTVQII